MRDLQDLERPPLTAFDRLIVTWLITICVMIVAMIILGGITRLTRSGLSMVSWNPILGILPPLHRSDWVAAFQRYQRYPEYRLLNHGMSLADFRSIFLWEYVHRLLGRLIALVLAGPGLFLFFRGKISPILARRLAAGLLLIVAQGALGWYMVRSGLADTPHVSPYRLAAHLGLGLLSLAYFVWLVLDLRFPRGKESAAEAGGPPSAWIRAFTLLLMLQILYGALTAGLKAGFAYNTFPKMNGEWIPSAIWRSGLGWSSLVGDSATVQFIHRIIGLSLLLSVALLTLDSRARPLTRRQRAGVRALTAIIPIQFALGVMTLVTGVPIVLASLHQLGACISFVAAIHLNHAIRPLLSGPRTAAARVPPGPGARFSTPRVD